MTRSPARWRMLALAPVLLFLASCVSYDAGALHQILAKQELTLSEGVTPEGAVEGQVLSLQKSGFYLFGVIPIVPTRLEEMVNEMARRARKLGAHGVSHLAVDVQPASAFKFSVFPLPDWSSLIRVQGTSYHFPGRKGPMGTGGQAQGQGSKLPN